MIPLSSSGRRARWCRFTMFTPSTMTRPVFVKTRTTLPSLPLSSPRTTRTVSPDVTWSGTRSALSLCRLRLTTRMRSVFRYFRSRISEHLGRERDDLHVLPLAKLARHRTEDARCARLPGLVDDDDGVFVEPDVSPVFPPRLLRRAHDHRGRDVRLLPRPVRQRVLHGDDHRVAESGVAATRPAEHADDEGALGARVVGDLDHRLL